MAEAKISLPGTLTIKNCLVFDGVSPELLEGPVHIADGRIVEVGGRERPADRIVDAAGGTVLPGLIDAHFHAYALSFDMLGIESTPLSYVALGAAARLKRTLHRGFTTVRDPAGGDAGFARAIAEGLLPAPRYLWTGAALSQTGGHGDVRRADSHVCGSFNHTVEVVDGVDPLRRAVRQRFLRGAHAIKIMCSGGVVSLSGPIDSSQYSDEEIRVVADEAKRRGSYVAAHAYSQGAIQRAVRNGVRSIEHGNLLDEETAALMADAGAFLVPTLSTYDAMERRGAEIGLAPASQEKNREVLAAGRTAVEFARAAGVRVGFGTDLVGDLEDEQLRGLQLQVELDGALLALRSATSVNAELLGLTDVGQVREGWVADLLVVGEDPLEAPETLWTEDERRIVIQGGQVIQR